MKRLSGFSLMEMMVVLLIISVVAAASAPMINRKMLTDMNQSSPWIWTGGRTIAFDVAGDNNASATIGGQRPPQGINSKFHIRATGTAPHISFTKGDDNVNTMRLRVNGTGFSINTDGNNPSNGSVVIGNGSTSWGNSTVIGQNAFAFENGVAIGQGANSSNTGAVAIGFRCLARAHSISIGENAGQATRNSAPRPDNSIAIGFNASGSQNSIAMGNGITSPVGAITIGNGNSELTQAPGSVIIGSDIANIGENSIVIGNTIDNDITNTSSRNAITIGSNNYARGDRAISIGREYSLNGSRQINYASGRDSIAIGSGAQAQEFESIAIGCNATSKGGIAIGSRAQSDGYESPSAIGFGANATGKGSTAIGFNAVADHEYQITLGDDKATVYIPGNLRVDGDVELAVNEGSRIKVRLGRGHSAEMPGSSRFSYLVRNEGSSAEADKVLLGHPNPLPSPTLPSDRRLKNVGKPFTGSLAEIKKLEIFNYTYKKDKTKTPCVGVMAQDLQKIFPNAVTKGEDGFLRIRMEDMFYALVNAVKELDAKIEAFKSQEIFVLKDRVSKLEKENKALEKRLSELEKKLK